MATHRPPTIDPVAAMRWRAFAPAISPWLHEEVARRMADRLQWIRRAPAGWANWDAVRGGLDGHRLVAALYPKATVQVVEPSARLQAAAQTALRQGWWQRGGRVAFGLPPAASMQMVWANMTLHAAADPQALLADWHAALATDGFLMFSCLGPDSLRELRAVYAAMGWPPAGPAFTDMHDWGDMLVAAGFAEPVMDMERTVLTYDSPERMLAELRDIGRNLHPARFAALRGRDFRRRLLAAIDTHGARDAQGRLQLTIELAYGHAFKPAPRVRLAAESAVSLRDMRDMLQRGRSAGA